MTRLHRLQWVLTLLLLTANTLAWADSLSARLDRDQISLEDTVTLQLLYQGHSDEEPDLTTLEDNFEIVQRGHSSSFSFSTNGNAVSTVQWTFVLSPKIAGQLLIPPFSIEGTQSKPLNVTVTENATHDDTYGKDVYLETSADKNSAYVQEQIKVSYRLFYAVQLSNLEPKLFQLPDVRTEELPRREYTQQVGHRNYNVMEFTVAVSTDKSGKIVLPSLRWTAYAEDPNSGMMGFRSGRSTIQRLNTKEIELDIKPRPASFPANATWLPAQNLNLTQQWSQPPDQFKVGEPITRTLIVTAEGVRAEQLPTLVGTSQNDDLKFYPDKPELDTQTTQSSLAATRREAVAIVPNKAGLLTLPAIVVSWWDTATDSLKTAELPEQVINVAEAAPGSTATTNNGLPDLPKVDDVSSSSTDITKPSKPNLWPWIAATLFLSNLIFIGLWLHERGRTPSVTATKREPLPIAKSPSDHFNLLVKYCESNDAKLARDALLQWANAYSHQRFTSLAQVANWLDNSALTESLTQLDKALFGSNLSTWQGTTLAQQLKDWLAAHKLNQKATDDDLQSLY